MAQFYFFMFIAMPVLVMSLALWLSTKITAVESTFVEMLRLAVVVRFVTFIPFVGVIGWGAYFAASRLPLLIVQLIKTTAKP